MIFIFFLEKISKVNGIPKSKGTATKTKIQPYTTGPTLSLPPDFRDSSGTTQVFAKALFSFAGINKTALYSIQI